jgi:hypothetical protein
VETAINALILTVICYVEGRVQADRPPELAPGKFARGMGHFLEQFPVVVGKDTPDIVERQVRKVNSGKSLIHRRGTP